MLMLKWLLKFLLQILPFSLDKQCHLLWLLDHCQAQHLLSPSPLIMPILWKVPTGFIQVSLCAAEDSLQQRNRTYTVSA